MLVGAEPLVRQPAEEPQVALAYQALARLCGLFYLDNHPNLFIDFRNAATVARRAGGTTMNGARRPKSALANGA